MSKVILGKEFQDSLSEGGMEAEKEEEERKVKEWEKVFSSHT